MGPRRKAWDLGSEQALLLVVYLSCCSYRLLLIRKTDDSMGQVGSISTRQGATGNTKYLAQLPPSMGRKSKTFDTLEQAQAWLGTQTQADKDLGSMSLSEALEAWLSTAAIKATVRKAYGNLGTRHVNPSIGSSKLTDVSPADIDRVMAATPANSTRGKVGKVLGGLFRWALAHGHVETDPYSRSQAQRLVKLAGLQVQPRPSADNTWSIEELRYFLEAEADDTYRLLWLFFAITGARRGEAVGLTWEQTNLDQSYVWLQENVTAVSGQIIIEARPKNWQRRRAYIGTRMVEALRGLPRESRWVFSRSGLHLSPEAVTGKLTRLTNHLGLPLLGGPHGLRRTFATLADLMGVRERVVQQALGHAPNVTQRYQKVSEAELVELATRMESLIM